MTLCSLTAHIWLHRFWIKILVSILRFSLNKIFVEILVKFSDDMTLCSLTARIGFRPILAAAGAQYLAILGSLDMTPEYLTGFQHIYPTRFPEVKTTGNLNFFLQFYTLSCTMYTNVQ